jgi:hypothetical protein
MSDKEHACGGFTKEAAFPRRYLSSRIFLLLAAASAVALWAGCGSDGSTGPRGKYPLTGTATLDDQTDYSGVRVRVVETGATVATAADGSFTLASLADGDYTLKASKDFYSTLTRNLQVRNGLLVDPIGELDLARTFFIYMESDSLHYTFRSDSVYVWMVLQNDDVEPLNLYDSFVIPYDFFIYDPSEKDKIVWQWSLIRPPRNDDKYDFHRSIPAADTIRINPNVAWDKKTMSGSLVTVGSYDVEGQINLTDSRGKMWNYVTAKHRIEIEP